MVIKFSCYLCVVCDVIYECTYLFDDCKIAIRFFYRFDIFIKPIWWFQNPDSVFFLSYGFFSFDTKKKSIRVFVGGNLRYKLYINYDTSHQTFTKVTSDHHVSLLLLKFENDLYSILRHYLTPQTGLLKLLIIPHCKGIYVLPLYR